jgi:hypothetical protein
MKLLLCTLASAVIMLFGAGDTEDTTAESVRASKDVTLQADPLSAFWLAAIPIHAEKDTHGKAVPGHKTVILSRWTKNNLYFLFICPYEELNLKPDPTTKSETNQLWNWDVAEVFIGTDFDNINRYKEFEVSPQGEWIDLDIDLSKPHHEDGWVWNSGFQSMARIDQTNKTWYAAVSIPFASIDTRKPAPGNTFRINFFRSQGPSNNRKNIVWQPTMAQTFHVPSRFGLLKLGTR